MPPPVTKEDVTMATVMGSLPDVRQSCLQMSLVRQLGRQQPDMVRRDLWNSVVPTSEDIRVGAGVWVPVFWKEERMCLFFLLQVPLGHHREDYFSGPEPKAVLRQFQTDLDNLEREIVARNEQLDLPYEYLRPSRIENSIAA